MISLLNEQEKDFVLKQLNLDKYQNVYFYLDFVNVGICGDNVKCYGVSDCGNVVACIYVYYDSVQLFECGDLDDVLCEIADFICQHQFMRISSSYHFINELRKYLGGYIFTAGVIMRGHYTEEDERYTFSMAKGDDYRAIAELMCKNSEFASSYSEKSLCRQLIERNKKNGCKNIVFYDKGVVIGHFATYVETNDMAILSGLIVHNDYRNIGLGRALVIKLTNDVIVEGKVPILYCYNMVTMDWYKNLGWGVVSECAKLTREK